MILSVGKEILWVAFWGEGSFPCQHYSASISTQSRIIAKTASDARIMPHLLKAASYTLPLPITSRRHAEECLAEIKATKQSQRNYLSLPSTCEMDA
jgi:hypothetical protein